MRLIRRKVFWDTLSRCCLHTAVLFTTLFCIDLSSGNLWNDHPKEIFHRYLSFYLISHPIAIFTGLTSLVVQWKRQKLLDLLHLHAAKPVSHLLWPVLLMLTLLVVPWITARFHYHGNPMGETSRPFLLQLEGRDLFFFPKGNLEKGALLIRQGQEHRYYSSYEFHPKGILLRQERRGKLSSPLNNDDALWIRKSIPQTDLLQEASGSLNQQSLREVISSAAPQAPYLLTFRMLQPLLFILSLLTLWSFHVLHRGRNWPMRSAAFLVLSLYLFLSSEVLLAQL